MTDIIDQAAAWLTAYRVEAWTVGSIAALAVIGVILYEVTRRITRTNTNIKSAVGYGVVQVGMAYVTITGGYDFWAHVAHMPTFEAWAVAVIVESAQWWFIGRIFRYMAGHHTVTADDGTTTEARNEGYGPAGPKFWSAVIGGGTLAVVGAVFAPEGSVSLAIGRAVVVYIGSSMFDLLLRERVYWSDPDKEGKTTLLITPRRLMVKMGILAAEKRDLHDDDREWTLRRMTRAIRWRNDGNRVFRWFGTRALRRSMEGGGSGLLRDATDRYAQTWVLVNEVNAKSSTMAGAIDRARQLLTVPTPDAAPPPADPPPAEPVAPAPPSPPADPQPPVVAALPVAPPQRPAPPVGGVRVRQGGSNADAAALREQAVSWAVGQLRNGVRLTAKSVGVQFGSGEEWGRQRLNEARSRVGEVATVNGNVPSIAR